LIMRVRGLAFVGLVVGAFLASPSSSIVSATAVQSQSSSSSNTHIQSIEKFFSSDNPETLHEAKNQGTLDEPKAWPEANAWLHASLSETEKDFLSLAVTGTVSPTGQSNGGLTGSQLVDTGASVQVRLRFFRNPLPNNFGSQLQTDLINALGSGSSTTSISFPSFQQNNIGNGVYHVATFVLQNPGSTPAGAIYVSLASQFANANSALRITTSFQDIDLSFYPQASWALGPSTASPTTPIPTTPVPTTPTPTTATPTTPVNTATTATTATPTTAAPTPTTTAPTGNSNYCGSHPTACLNGGTCVNDPANSPYYTCTCPSGFIGHECQFSLFNNSKRNKVQGVLPRGRSVTRPNAVRSATVKLAQ